MWRGGGVERRVCGRRECVGRGCVVEKGVCRGGGV